MKKARLKKQTNKNNNTLTEDFSIKSKIITTIVLLLMLVGVYFLTTKIVEKQNNDEDSSTTINVREDNDINYSDIENIKDSSYYLLLYNEEDENNSNYDTYINSLKYSNYSVEFYYINLSKDENKGILGDEEKLDDLTKLKIKDTTLIYVEDSEIKNTYVGSENILNQLLSFFISSEDNNTITSTSDNSNSNKESDSNSNENNNSDANTEEEK